MNLLFITVADMRDVDTHGIYSDLMREFLKSGHEVFIASPAERRNDMPTSIIEYTNSTDWHAHLHILKIRTGNIQKTSFIEKGISTILLENQLKNGIKKYFSNVRFDMVLYTTPPITLVKPVLYVKKRDKAHSYLMLKDIFPQNAVDIGVLTKRGLKGILYKYFRQKEKKLYEISDTIGCMSKANVDYIRNHNKELKNKSIEVCPNSVEVMDLSVDGFQRIKIRERYGIPVNKTVFVYGGNLGKPQGIHFLIECLKNCHNDNVFFLIIGNGTEYSKIENYIKEDEPKHVKLLSRLPQADYDAMIGSCDVGLIFLDHRFTIPNFPSRLLGYMQAKIPVLAATDPNTDIGQVITEGEFGWWCESNNVSRFVELVDEAITCDLKTMGIKGFSYILNKYTVDCVCKIITSHC
jgi:hypothetical protein